MNDQQSRHSKTRAQRPHAAEQLEPEDLLRLGEVVRDLVTRLGYGTSAAPLETALFREAINAAVYTLTLHQAARASLKERDEARGLAPPESLPLTMADLAQDIMHRTFAADAMTLPSEREQRARIRFALALDPTCCDAYLAQGDIEERKGHTQKAKAAYEWAMTLLVCRYSAQGLAADAWSAGVA